MTDTVYFDRLREDLAIPESAADNTYLQTVFDRAAEIYPDDIESQEAQSRVYVLRNLIAQSIKRPDYVMNETSVSLGSMRIGLEKLLDRYEKQLDSVVSDSIADFMEFDYSKKFKDQPSTDSPARWIS